MTNARLMKAAVCRRYGPPDVVEIVEVPRPTPGDRDVLIKTRTTTISAADWRLRTGTVPPGFGLFLRVAVGFTGPRDAILGTEVAGEVVEVGRSVNRFAPGDKVFAAKMGMCHAEYVAVREDAVAMVPPNLSFGESAALTFGGLTAVTFLRDKALIKAGERVLVNGASGAVGSAAVQLAKHFRAAVTGVCSAANADLVRSLGADHVIDYAVEDFTKGRERYDIIFDAVGNSSFGRCRQVLALGGRLCLVVGSLGEMLGSMVWASRRGGRKILGGIAAVRQDNLEFLRALAESGAYKPFVDRTYPFARIVEAHAYVDTGRKRGNVVISLE